MNSKDWEVQNVDEFTTSQYIKRMTVYELGGLLSIHGEPRFVRWLTSKGKVKSLKTPELIHGDYDQETMLKMNEDITREITRT